MGLNANGIKFLLDAWEHGASFLQVAMIGRQEMQIEPPELFDILRRFRINQSIRDVETILTEANGYAEPFLSLLGAREIASFDASDYEGATCLHDFNRPIPDDLKNQFSVVLDGGSLEHIFNFPVAIKNCMEMVREGGHFLAMTPANNHCGHGFYQFSPELFFRIFSEANGFETERVIVFEETFHPPWYKVIDPAAIKERVMLINSEPSSMLVTARKTKTVDIFACPPQQSDYSLRWISPHSTEGVNSNSSRGILKKIARIPFSAFRRGRMLLARSTGMLNRNSHHFTKINLNG